MIREITPKQLNACLVVIANKGKAAFGRYPIRFFSGYGKNGLILTAWSMAGAQLLTAEVAEEVVRNCKAKNRAAHILDLRLQQ